MTIAIIQHWEGATLGQYDEIKPKLDSTTGGGKGALSHWVAKSDTGIMVVDVWETQEEFQTFADKQLIPIAKKIGIPNTPEFTFHQVHQNFP